MSNNKQQPALGKLRPILFNTAMVQAILEDRKTQTRRVLKGNVQLFDYIAATDVPCPYGKVGDVLWVRETVSRFSFGGCYAYKADNDPEDKCTKWRPSIHMPFEACRLFVKITNIRVERLQDISESDAIHEGIGRFSKDNTVYKYGLDGWPWQEMQRKPSLGFSILWKSINGSESWNANPWVWVIEFKQITKDEAKSCTMKTYKGDKK